MNDLEENIETAFNDALHGVYQSMEHLRQFLVLNKQPRDVEKLIDCIDQAGNMVRYANEKMAIVDFLNDLK